LRRSEGEITRSAPEGEQHYLDILFSLPANLRYNFARVAEASFKGLTHTPETKAQMSDSKYGANNPMYGKVPANAFQSGANNPMYGRTGPLNPMFGKTLSEEIRAKMSASQTGTLNPMYGKTGELSPVSKQVNVYSLDFFS